ncbi:class I SAM-dependent methyltransferase [Massilia sp. W12]|uniref:class I SAM-dependent methyltransferase n=1 Tax=Massilia sp. W12 TaxID=3126507 RepID=UPI0030CEE4EE
MYSQTQIDPMVSFRNSQSESVRGTILNLQRKSLVMEVYNPYSIVQISEVLHDLTIRLRSRNAYVGKAVVVSIVNTGLTAVVSVTLIDEWRELVNVTAAPGSVGDEARAFVKHWEERFSIGRDYQIVVNEMRAFLSDVSHWVEQVDLAESMPKEDGRLRADIFYELAEPLVQKTGQYFDQLNIQAAKVEPEQAAAHRAFAQAALHPLLLRAPFVYRTFTKPLGYAGDFQMVNQIMDDPRQGPSTYFQIVNAAFLATPVATAHRNRIDILVDYLVRLAERAREEGRQYRVLNVACGPAVEVQRFLQTYPEPDRIHFELLDFSEEALQWTNEKLNAINAGLSRKGSLHFQRDSVHQLIKRRLPADLTQAREFDAVYCAGLFDYLSDKVCLKLMQYFSMRARSGASLLITNVHTDNPQKSSMEHLLEWYLIYRDEARMCGLFPDGVGRPKLWVDSTGVNVFAEVQVV